MDNNVIYLWCNVAYIRRLICNVIQGVSEEKRVGKRNIYSRERLAERRHWVDEKCYVRSSCKFIYSLEFQNYYQNMPAQGSFSVIS